MNLRRSEDFGMELGAMLLELEKTRSEIAKANAFIKFAESQNDMEKAMHYTNVRTNVEGMLDKMVEVTCTFAGKSTYEEAELLLSEVKSKLLNASQALDKWQNMKTSYELAVTTGQLATDEKRLEAEQAVEITKQRYDAALALIDGIVPARSNLIALA